MKKPFKRVIVEENKCRKRNLLDILRPLLSTTEYHFYQLY